MGLSFVGLSLGFIYLWRNAQNWNAFAFNLSIPFLFAFIGFAVGKIASWLVGLA